MRRGEPRRREVLQRVRGRSRRARTGRARSAVSSPSSSSISSASPDAPRASTPRTSAPSSSRTTSVSAAELESHGGRVEKFVGDAVMGVFGAPVAYGDDAERAVRAAFAVRDWAEQDGLELRVAVNTGEAIVELEARPEHGEALVAGDVVNTAARLQSAAARRRGARRRGDIHGDARTPIEYRPAQPVWRRERSAPSRRGSHFGQPPRIGERPTAPGADGRPRSRARTCYRRSGSASSTRRASHFVTVFGPAGHRQVAASRSSSRQLVADRTRASSAAARTPYGASTPYSAFAQQVKQTARIFDSDDAIRGTSEARRRDRLARGPAAAEEHAPNLAVLLGLDGETARSPTASSSSSPRASSSSRSRCAVRRCSSTRTSTGPTRACSTCSRRSPPACATSRCSSSRSRDPSSSAIGRLGRRSSGVHGPPARAAHRGGERRSSPSSSRQRRRWTNGAERWRRRQRATRSSSRSSPASHRRAAVDGLDELPTSIRAIIAARLDALPAAERDVLVDASVGGPSVLARRAAEIEDRADLSQLLGSLEARDLIQREAVSRIKGDQQFAFKHGLIHDVAYADASARGPPRASTRRSRGSSRRRPTSGQSHEALGAPLARGGRERARRRAPDRRGGPGRPRLGEGTTPWRSIARRSSSSPTTTPRRRDVTRKLGGRAPGRRTTSPDVGGDARARPARPGRR